MRKFFVLPPLLFFTLLNFAPGQDAGAKKSLYLADDGNLLHALVLKDAQGGFAGFSGHVWTIEPDGTWNRAPFLNQTVRKPDRQGKFTKPQLAALERHLIKQDLLGLPGKLGKGIGANPHVFTITFGDKQSGFTVPPGAGPPKKDSTKMGDPAQRFAALIRLLKRGMSAPEETKVGPPKTSGPIVSPPVRPSVSPAIRDLVGGGAKTAPGKPMPEREVLDDFLSKFKAARAGQVLAVDSAALKTVLPKHSFFVLRFRQFPVAIQPAPPLAVNNVFAISGKTVTHLKSDQDLNKLFTSTVTVMKDAASAQSAVTAWLRLAQEFRQDGFFEFDAPKVVVRENGGSVTAEGVASVVTKRGDKGEVTVAMVFVDGRPKEIRPGGKVHAGIRPRCQATLLLDANPIVRQIARRDLVVMGSAAREYLVGQRAKASPELKKVIDDVWLQILAEGR